MAAQEFRCLNCGGEAVFDTSSQKMKCPFCDAEYETDALKSYEEALKEDVDDDMHFEMPSSEWAKEENEKVKRYKCNTCGGRIIANAEEGVTTCPYCDSEIIITEQFSGDIRPDKVIPFKLNKKQAIAELYKYFHSKKLLPDDFKDKRHLQEIKGVYVPFWLYSAKATGSFRMRATRVRVFPLGDYIYTETSFFALLRSGTLDFNNVPVDGSEKMADDMMESLEPYDLNDGVDFNTAYLAGFLADRYDVESDTASARANERIRNTTTEHFMHTAIGYNSVDIEHSSIKLDESKATYALLPVWLLTTKWQGKKYVFAMNGQTGKMVGDLPVDKGKCLARLFTFGGIFAAGVFALGYLLWLGGIL
jgi:DNA-directed RNA polymerase subunit RPC12/RpoP